MGVFSQRSLDNLRGVHPDLVRLMELSIGDSPVDFTVTCGVRTLSRQQELYAQGRSRPGPVVTHCDGIRKKSAHQLQPDGFGHAVDLYPFVGGRVEVNDAGGLERIAAHIKSVARAHRIPVVWGGDWKIKDYPHFEWRP